MARHRRSNSLSRFRDKENGNSLPRRIFNVDGALPCFNPTSAYFQNSETDTFRRLDQGIHSDATADDNTYDDHDRNLEFAYHWTSRNNRKGIHDLVIPRERAKFDRDTYKYELSVWRSVLVNLKRMLTSFPYWDISFLIAICFLIGSGIWVINGVLTFLPMDQPGKSIPGQSTIGGGVVAFIGTCIFALANLLLWIETINEPRNQCQGWSAEYKVDDASGFSVKMRPGSCQSHHGNKSNLVGNGATNESTQKSQNGHANAHSHTDESRWPNPAGNSSSRNPDHSQADESRWPDPANDSSSRTDENTALLGRQSSAPTAGSPSSHSRSWRWYPTRRELTEHYVHELSFIGVTIQLLGATFFFVGAFPRLPPIYNLLSRPVEQALFLFPKLAGGICFTLSNTLYLLETQDYWFIPAPWSIGWHIGGWSVLGSIGFALSSGLAMNQDQGFQYHSALAVIWASVAYFIASFLMWYESLNKYTMHIL